MCMKLNWVLCSWLAMYISYVSRAVYLYVGIATTTVYNIIVDILSALVITCCKFMLMYCLLNKD